MIMKHTCNILQTIVLAVALIAAGQGAWAQATQKVGVMFGYQLPNKQNKPLPITHS